MVRPKVKPVASQRKSVKKTDNAEFADCTDRAEILMMSHFSSRCPNFRLVASFFVDVEVFEVTEPESEVRFWRRLSPSEIWPKKKRKMVKNRLKLRRRVKWAADSA
ncbi:hypothetical protein V9T40_004889 [Parthenolecanium corni]|uniref:Uncharacterized protein n=1 Tax=Parthenolecanium corni TaxID=536013 RepID=A0AAN9TTY4_9HEMI